MKTINLSVSAVYAVASLMKDCFVIAIDILKFIIFLMGLFFISFFFIESNMIITFGEIQETFKNLIPFAILFSVILVTPMSIRKLHKNRYKSAVAIYKHEPKE